jgi:predicted ATPase/DNA-binding SARP family transcriptional activator
MLTIRLLGSPHIQQDNHPLVVDTRKAIALLAYLAVQEGIQSRATLDTLLWGDSDASRARASLRRTLSTLNSALNGHYLVIDREALALPDHAEVWADVRAFRAALRRCATHGHPAATPCADCIPPLMEAVSLYQGDFMAGFTLRDSPDFDEWQTLQSENLRFEYTNALERLVTAFVQNAQIESAIPYARTWLATDPLNEAAHRRLMELYVWSGERHASLRQYEQCATLIHAEFGAPPEAETTTLYETIKAGHSLPRPDAPAAPIPLIEAPKTRWDALPTPLTPFIGRGAELAQVQKWLIETDECRLVTLVGWGGMGKTRLALKSGQAVRDVFEGRVVWVGLATVSTEVAVLTTLAQSLDLTLTPKNDPLQQIIAHLQQSRFLLILDNLEHLPFAPSLIQTLLQQAATLMVLATSRERLYVPGEWVLEVGGLEVPQAATPTEMTDAMALFIQTTQRINPARTVESQEMETVSAICRRVNGIPLAIELAATWVRLLSVGEIWAELNRTYDFLATNAPAIPERHRSLRVVFDHTWKQLSPQQQNILARLSLFRGNFPRAAAMEVAEATLPDLLALCDHSLLRRRDEWFTMHDMVRYFAHAHLGESSHRYSHRHADYFGKMAKAADREIHGPTAKQWLDTLEAHHSNFRAALEWSVAHESAVGAEIAAYFWHVWDIRGHWREGMQWVQAILGQNGNVSPFINARLHHIQGRLALQLNEYGLAESALQEARVLWEQAGNNVELYRTLGELGTLYWRQGAWHQAYSVIEGSLHAARRADYRVGIGKALNNLGGAAYQQGQYAHAYDLFEQALILKREEGDQRGIATTLNNLGHIAKELGDYGAAESRYAEALEILNTLGDPLYVGIATVNLGEVAYAAGDLPRAHDYLTEGTAQLRTLNHTWSVAQSVGWLGLVSVAEGEYKTAQEHLRESLLLAQESKAQPAQVLAIVGWVTLAIEMGKETLIPEQTVALATALDILASEGVIVMERPIRRLHEQNLEHLKQTFSSLILEQSWQKGASWNLATLSDMVLEQLREISPAIKFQGSGGTYPSHRRPR